MPRRRKLIGILFLALLLLAGYGLLWWCFAPPASAINRANALKIKPGMTLAEVEAILGGPARNESGLTLAVAWAPTLQDSSGRLFYPESVDGFGLKTTRYGLSQRVRDEIWRTHACEVAVYFNQKERVSGVDSRRVVRDWSSYGRFGEVLKKLDRWLGDD